jgi:hypothetical protein
VNVAPLNVASIDPPPSTPLILKIDSNHANDAAFHLISACTCRTSQLGTSGSHSESAIVTDDGYAV